MPLPELLKRGERPKQLTEETGLEAPVETEAGVEVLPQPSPERPGEQVFEPPQEGKGVVQEARAEVPVPPLEKTLETGELARAVAIIQNPGKNDLASLERALVLIQAAKQAQKEDK